jgi:hypothetical protein
MRLSIAMLVAVILGVSGLQQVAQTETISVQVMSTDNFYQWLCQKYESLQTWTICKNYTTTTTTTTTTAPTTTMGMVSQTATNAVSQSTTTGPFILEITTPGTTGANGKTSTSATPLQNALWCRFNNGSYLSRGATFMDTACRLCQCQQSRDIRCVDLVCKTTYCIDDSAPFTKKGQCCSQCSYENNTNTCTVNGATFPHGTVIKVVDNKLQCWCQMGSVECRKYVTSVFSGLDLWGQGTAIYIIAIIICVFILFGTVLCGSCTLIFYYYYKRNLTIQAYDQYMTNAGWQPMGDEEQAVDANAEEKKAEADQSQFAHEYPVGNSEEYIPPPYALYNGNYPTEQQAKDQKYI